MMNTAMMEMKITPSGLLAICIRNIKRVENEESLLIVKIMHSL